MKVRIIKCDNPNRWYQNQIGSVLNVFAVPHKDGGDIFLVDTNFNAALGIERTDLEILPIEPAPQPEPFDLERALKGDEVICGGYKVSDIYLAPVAQMVVGLIDGRGHAWTKEGAYFENGNMIVESTLYMAPIEPKTKTIWVNVFTDNYTEFRVGRVYNTKKEAKIAPVGPHYVGAYPITITLPDNDQSPK